MSVCCGLSRLKAILDSSTGRDVVVKTIGLEFQFAPKVPEGMPLTNYQDLEAFDTVENAEAWVDGYDGTFEYVERMKQQFQWIKKDYADEPLITVRSSTMQSLMELVESPAKREVARKRASRNLQRVKHERDDSYALMLRLRTGLGVSTDEAESAADLVELAIERAKGQAKGPNFQPPELGDLAEDE